MSSFIDPDEGATLRHVFASPVGASFIDPAILVGEAASLAEAVTMVRKAGYTVIEEDVGGNYETYDAEDGPGIYGYEKDGMGAFSVSIEAKQQRPTHEPEESSP